MGRNAASASIVDPDPLAPDQPVLGRPGRHPVANGTVHRHRQPGARPARPRMVGHPPARRRAQKFPRRQAVRAAPFEATLGADALEIADPAAATGVPGARRRTPPTAPRRGRRQQRLQPIVERMAR
jgi:hypothetical protein